MTPDPRDDHAGRGTPDDDLLQGFAPTCATCLLTLQPDGTPEVPRWRCAGCGLLVIS